MRQANVGDVIILQREIKTRTTNFQKGETFTMVDNDPKYHGGRFENVRGTVWGLHPEDYTIESEEIQEDLPRGGEGDEMFLKWVDIESQNGNATSMRNIKEPGELSDEDFDRYCIWKQLVKKFKINNDQEMEDINDIIYWHLEYLERGLGLGIWDSVSEFSSKIPLNEKQGNMDNNLFDEWKKLEVESGNMGADVDTPEELEGDSRVLFKNYSTAVSAFPDFDKNDVAVAVSSIMYDVGEFSEIFYNELEESQYEEIKELIENPINEGRNRSGKFDELVDELKNVCKRYEVHLDPIHIKEALIFSSYYYYTADN